MSGLRRIKQLLSPLPLRSPATTIDTDKRLLHDCFILIAGNLYRLSNFSEGGVCQIFKATATRRNLPALSVKMIQPKWIKHPAVRRQFNTESQILRGIQSPGLPRYVARGNFNDRTYLAYEFLPGVPLIRLAQSQTLFGQGLLQQSALLILKQILEQVRYLHNKLNPVVHGDISAENIIINAEKKATLADFGCAHFLNIANSQSYRWLAKPSYLSPEQARGESWGPPSDIYQIGILFYEMTMGKRWIRGKTPREKMLFAASVKPPEKDFLAAWINPGLSALVARMLHSQPEKRPGAEEILERLGAIVVG